jgi:hypothetical protein
MWNAVRAERTSTTPNRIVIWIGAQYVVPFFSLQYTYVLYVTKKYDQSIVVVTVLACSQRSNY